jgi:hypothetical protein
VRGAAFAAALIYIPALNSIFGTAPRAYHWAVVSGKELRLVVSARGASPERDERPGLRRHRTALCPAYLEHDANRVERAPCSLPEAAT